MSKRPPPPRQGPARADLARVRGVNRVPSGLLRTPSWTTLARSARAGAGGRGSTPIQNTLTRRSGEAVPGLLSQHPELARQSDQASIVPRTVTPAPLFLSRRYEMQRTKKKERTITSEPPRGVEPMAAFWREEEDRLSRGRAKRAGYAAPPLDSLSARARSPPRARRLRAPIHPTIRPPLVARDPQMHEFPALQRALRINAARALTDLVRAGLEEPLAVQFYAWVVLALHEFENLADEFEAFVALVLEANPDPKPTASQLRQAVAEELYEKDFQSHPEMQFLIRVFGPKVQKELADRG